MLSILNRARKSLTRVAAAAAVMALAACDPALMGPGGGGGGPTIDTSVPVPVALLVPGGSGQAGEDLLARHLRNGAQLAISDLGSVKIDLRVYNTAGNPAQAQAMAIKAVDDGAKIILGPVFAQAANAAGVAVASRGVNVLSFSNNTDIAGGNVYVLGPTFQNTADRLAQFAVRQGKRKIMVLNDQTPEGEIGRTAIERGVGQAGGSVVARANYEFSQNGIVNAAPQIAAQMRSSGAEAVFMTANPTGSLPLLTQMLHEQNLDPAMSQFIGLTRWDVPAATVALPGVQGGWFAMPDPTLYKQYEARYTAAFGEAPHPLAGLAYDGIAAIGALVKQGRANALTGAALTQSSGFVGVSGIFRLRGDGTNQRGLAVAQIRNKQVVILDAAPRSFSSGFGF